MVKHRYPTTDRMTELPVSSVQKGSIYQATERVLEWAAAQHSEPDSEQELQLQVF